MTSLQHNHILVVDDSEDNALMVQFFLESEGYTVNTVNSGKDALEEIARSLPDLLLIDIMMPSMTGYDLALQIRADYTLAVPIILMTALAKIEAKEIIEAISNDYIYKPLDLEDLRQKVIKQLDPNAA